MSADDEPVVRGNLGGVTRQRQRLKPAIDYPFPEAFTTPTDDVKVAVNRGSGSEFAQNYRIAALDYTDWVNAGRPERIFVAFARGIGLTRNNCANYALN
jgi:hypothetical protein